MLGSRRRFGAALVVAASVLLGAAVPHAHAAFSFSPFVGSPFPLGGQEPRGMEVGDVNGDGRADLVTANRDTSSVTVLLGNGAGGFTASAGSPFGVGFFPQSLAIGSLNSDNKPDLAVANSNGNTTTVLLGDGSGGFTEAAGSPIGASPGPLAVAIADFNGDGKGDIASAGADVAVSLGNGSGGFTAAPGSPFAVGTGPRGLAVADVSGDGKLDIATADRSSDTATVLIGDGAGAFTAVTGGSFIAGDEPRAVAIAELSGDGKLDLAVVNEVSEDVTVLLGNGAGSFALAGGPIDVGAAPRDIAAADLNADGRIDLATANSGSDDVTVLIGNGTGGFAAATGSPLGAGDGARQVVVADFDRDGRPDLAASNDSSDDVTVLRNTSDAAFAIDPAGLAFAAQAAGTTSPPQAATLFSAGNAALQVADVRITGADVTDFLVSEDGCSGAAVPVLSNCVVRVRFAPASPGTKTATLTIAHNGGVDASYALTGTGDPAPVGPTGATGVQGPTGPMGPQGPSGGLGPAGANGPAGSTGAAGSPGAPGGSGQTGPQGLPGAQGPAGPNAAPQVVTCTAKAPRRGKKVKVTCRVKTVAATTVRLRRAGRTVATRRVRAGAHRLVFAVARGGDYRLRVDS